MTILLFLSIAFALVTACNFSCFQSSCRTTGGTNENCRCTSLTDRGTTRNYALCTADGATSCEKTDYHTGCNIQGDNTQCNLTLHTSGLASWFVSHCQAKSAPRCSQNLFGSSCEVVGENAECSATLLSLNITTWIVPECKADRALQCSIMCGTSSCEKNCAGTGKRADCHCFLHSDNTVGFLSSRCNCI
ncbi:hypothetical protein GEMRC1_004063 [Eukaryota sp. GEM-RC1]